MRALLGFNYAIAHNHTLKNTYMIECKVRIYKTLTQTILLPDNYLNIITLNVNTFKNIDLLVIWCMNEIISF